MAKSLKRGGAKVFWAVDPFHEKPREQLRPFEVLTKMFGKVPFTTQPVAMVALGHYNPSTHQFEEKWHDIAAGAKKCLEGVFSALKHPGVLPLHLIKQAGSSSSEAAAGFLSYAVEEGAQLLLVSSHARTGVDRLLLGSFAESLVLQSPLPVLVVNPQSKARKAPRIKQVLFPTDFSDLSLQAFKRTLALAADTGLSVMLFHKVQYLSAQIGPAFLYPKVSAESLKDLRDELKAEGERWVALAKRQGVKAKLHLDTANGRPLDKVLRASKKLGNASIIAMASQSGKVGALLPGSLTRQVLRHALCPVLVIHPEQQSLVKKFVERVALAGYRYTAHPAYF